MDNSVFLENIKKLEENKYNLRALDKLQNYKSKSLYCISFVKNNYSVLYNNKPIISNYAALEEAKRLIDTSIKDIKRQKLIGIFFSIASYHQVDYFLSLDSGNFAIVIEKDISLVKELLKNVLLNGLSRTIIILDENEIDVSNFFNFFIEENMLRNIVTVRHLRASLINSAYYDSLQIKYNTIIKEKIMSLSSNYYFAPLWSKNILYNLKINEGYGIEAYKNILACATPILIVSAGASIDNAIEKIRELSYTHFVLVLSHAFNAMIENNIIPDAVISTDGGFYSSIHLFKFIKTNIPIFTTHSAYPYPLNNIDKKRIFYFSHNESFESILYKKSEFFPMEGSVIMPALRIADTLNPSHIVLAGCDFCYVNEKTHSMYSSSFAIDFSYQNKLNSLENIRYKKINSKNNYIECFDFVTRPSSDSLLSYLRHFSMVLDSIKCKNIFTITKESARLKNVSIYDGRVKVPNKNIVLKEINPEYSEKELFFNCLKEFFDSLNKNNIKESLENKIAYMISPRHVDEFHNGNISFEDYKKYFLSWYSYIP